jgi:hypothetical protein
MTAKGDSKASPAPPGARRTRREAWELVRDARKPARPPGGLFYAVFGFSWARAKPTRLRVAHSQVQGIPGWPCLRAW